MALWHGPPLPPGPALCRCGRDHDPDEWTPADRAATEAYIAALPALPPEDPTTEDPEPIV